MITKGIINTRNLTNLFKKSESVAPKRKLQQAENIAYKGLEQGVTLAETNSYAFAIEQRHKEITKVNTLFIHHAWLPASLLLHDHIHLFPLSLPQINRRQTYQAFLKLLNNRYQNAYKKCATGNDIFNVSRMIKINIRKYEERVGIIDMNDNKVQHYPVWTPYREYLAAETAKNYQKKGVLVGVLGQHVFPKGNVWLPTRQNYIQLFEKYLSSASLTNVDEVADLGCGTGILSFVISKKIKKTAKIYGFDLNPDAVLSANLNASRLNIDNFHSYQYDLTRHENFKQFADSNKLPNQYSLIISNPPWLVAKKLNKQIGLEDGVYDENGHFLRSTLQFSQKYLKPNGRLILIYSSLSQQLGLAKKTVEQLAQKFKITQKLSCSYVQKLEKDDPLALYKQKSKIFFYELKRL